MKVVSPRQMSDIESSAYRDGASETDFMEEAGSGVALVVHEYVERHNRDRIVILLCGKGNNAGDAYVAGIHLLHLDYDVFAIQAAPIAECSNLCKQNYQRFMTEGGRQADTLSEFPLNGTIIDGLFGTGFRGEAEEPYAAIISLANNSGLPIIAVDIPSGLNGETGIAEGEAIQATATTFLGLPKMGFFLNGGWNRVGKLHPVDFGLPKEYISEFDPEMIMLTKELLKPIMPPIIRNRHKYSAGYVVGLAGSPGMPGAAILSSVSALRGGAGIVRLLYPDGMQTELSSSPYELIYTPFHFDNTPEIVAQMNRASATFVGPGLGRTPEVRALLQQVLPQLEKPCVIDADALNILAETDIALPKQTVLTPHFGEMMRLLNMTERPNLDLEFLKTCRSYAANKTATVVLKGAPSFILHADRPFLVNPTGDPGMATAGSGDILTGLIAALLAQGLTTNDAAALGVFLHGIAGEYAADDMTSYSVCATDMTYRFSEAFKFLL